MNIRIVIGLVALFLPSSIFAQFKNIRLDQGTTNIQTSEPSIIINKKNPKNIIAATNPDNIYYTIDGGNVWQSLKLSSPNGVFGQPVLVSDDKGTIYSLHLSSPNGDLKDEKSLNQILIHISRDGGKTWEEGSPLGLNASKDQRKPWATVDSKGNVWVAWTQYDSFNSADENCQTNILLSNSSNGKKWTKPFQISQTPGNCMDDDNTAFGAMPAIGVDGKAFVTWANQNKIFLDRSFGSGLWLTNDIAVGQQPGGWDMKIPGHGRCNGTPVFMIDQSKSIYQGSLYLVWADQRNGENDTDVWFMRSTNFGDNWSVPTKLGQDSAKCHQYMPWMTVDQSTGYIYTVFYGRSGHENNDTDVYLAYSSDGGISFKSRKISETPFTPDENVPFGGINNIAAHNGIITPVWTSVQDGKASVWTTIIKQADLVQAPQTASKKKKKGQ
ncbi:sialidase family protein [Chryseolinea sp. H1M3-3]|uniref:sialidase family protein n=1 Tax=Chryseolinea sp. H1M3-3 TaxID=3034144 RepID=UPI0023ECCA2E|nr:sialidase family protein [Chryseolinea sp. H1M3-3]